MEELDGGQRLAGHNVASLDAELIEFYCVEGTQLYGYFAHATFWLRAGTPFYC
jgi:hypothetical protein